MAPQIYLIRHGETAWSLSGQHTGRTDLQLTDVGVQSARRLAPRLAQTSFARVWTSPLARARTTAELAGFGSVALVEPDLVEWNYGTYEGLRTSEVQAARPDWSIFRDGAPGGEAPDDVGARADRVLARLRREAPEGNTALFSHGHFGRVLAARFLGLTVAQAALFALDTASLSVLGYEHDSLDEPVLRRWNA